MEGEGDCEGLRMVNMGVLHLRITQVAWVINYELLQLADVINTLS